MAVSPETHKWPEADLRLVFEMMMMVAAPGMTVKHRGGPLNERGTVARGHLETYAVTLFPAAPFSLDDTDIVNPRLFGTLHLFLARSLHQRSHPLMRYCIPILRCE